MSAKTETRLSQKCIEWVEKNGGIVYKQHGNEFSEAGVPDHLGYIEVYGVGLVPFAIELKNPGENPELIQWYQINRLRKLGVKAGCAHTLEEYKAIILS